MSTTRLARLGRLLTLGTLATALTVGATTAPSVAETGSHGPVSLAIITAPLEFGPTDLQAHERLVVKLKAAFNDGSGKEPNGSITLTDQDGAEIATAAVAGRQAVFRVPPPVTHVSASYTGGNGWSLSFGQTDVHVAKADLTPAADFSALRVDQHQPLHVGVTVNSSEPAYEWDAFYTLLARPQGTTGPEDVVLAQGRYPAPIPGTRQRLFDIGALTELGAGTYQVHFQATETAFHHSFTGLVGTITVDPARQPTGTAAVTPARATYGSGGARVAATLFRDVDRGPIDGTFQALVDGTPFGQPANVTSTDQVVLSLAAVPAGTHVVRVQYSGGTSYAPSLSEPTTLVIDPAHAVAQVTTTSTRPGGAVTVQVGTRDSQTTPTGVVVLQEDGRDVGSATLRGGVATVTLPATTRPGNHTYTAVYQGTADVLGSTSAPQTVHVAAPAPVTSRITGSVARRANAVTVRAVVSGSKPVTGRAQVLDGRRVVRTVVLRSSSRGRLTTVMRGLKPGVHRVTVRYLGSSTVKASARTWRVTVPRGR